MSIKNSLIYRKFAPFLKYFYYFIFDRHKLNSYISYRLSDEKLKYTHLLEAVNYVRVAEIPHVYFEFGCHSARTFSAVIRAADYLKMANFQCFAFDSFEGLPPTEKKEDGYFERGTFCTSRADFISLVKSYSGHSLENKNITEGFYDSSLTTDLQKRMPKVGMVHIDVDLYSSTTLVLEFLKPLMVEGTVILFDDWYCFPPGSLKGEKGALHEFCIKHPGFKVEEWKSYSTFGKSFFVVCND